MSVVDSNKALDKDQAGQWMHEFMAELYPICRSITGQGLRATLQRISEEIPLTLSEIASGETVFDWTVPREWNIRDAFVKDATGQRVVDFQAHNLHVLGYCVPVNKKVPLAELKEHCFAVPDHPEWIPYRTSYYKEQWGFCLSQERLDALDEGEYEVCVDSVLEDGSLTYGECLVPGALPDEVLVSCHTCHPSLANDNLSGIAVATLLAKTLAASTPRYSYRFVFAPGTIGAITWLARNESRLVPIKHGLVLACLGDPGDITYKRSRCGDAEIDLAVQYVLKQSGDTHDVRDFSPYGYDERQYCSPGINLPVGCFSRSGPGSYPEYHTSADNLDLVQPQYLADSLDKLLAVFEVLEDNETYCNLNPKCEPQLGKRGLYTAIGGRTDTKALEMATLWVLNYSDGAHSLLNIAMLAGVPFARIRKAADVLLDADLLEPSAPE